MKGKLVISYQIGSALSFQGDKSCKGYFTRAGLCRYAADQYET